MSIEISLAVIAVCMVIIMIVAVVIGIVLSKNIKNIDHTIATVEVKLDHTLDEVNATLVETRISLMSLNEVAVSVKSKLETTDPLFNCISKIGTLMEAFLSYVPTPEPRNQKIFTFSKKRKEDFEISDLADLVGAGVNLWQKLKK